MTEKTFVKKEFFDRYLIPLPLSKLAGNKKSKYIFSELEKRHPCFSSDFSFDSHLKVSKKGLFSDVVVIKNQKLADYKNRFGLTFENCKRKRFLPVKLKFAVYLFFLILLLGAGFVLIKKGLPKNMEENSENQTLENAVEISEKKENENLVKDFDFAGTFFDKVSVQNGELVSFFWRVDGFREVISANVKSVYPEDVTFDDENIDEKISTVSYQNGKSEFSVTFGKINLIEVSQNSVEKNHNEKDDTYFSKIREFLKSEKCQIQEENFKPYTIKFRMKNFETLGKLYQLLEDFDKGVTSISISSDSYGNFMIEMTVNENFSVKNGLNIGILAEKARLFESGKDFFPITKASVNETKKTDDDSSSKESVLLERGKKIGSVAYPDGRVLVFYKNKAGKILREWTKQK